MNMEIHYAEDWAALYVDGELHRDRYEFTVGDTHNVEETAFALLGVRQVQDDAFLRGQDQRDGVARTLDEVAAYASERDRRLTQARELREQAEALRTQAAELERGAGTLTP